MLPSEVPALFERVPVALFGPLSSALAPVYWALLARFYQHEFEREPFQLVRPVALEEADNILATSPLWAERRSELFERADDADDADDELEQMLDEAALRAASARRLVARLERAGWFRFEYRSGVGDVLSFFPYAARILEALVRVARDEQPVFQGYAHTIAALLRPDAFAAQPGAALSEATRHTLELVRELKILNRNIALHTQRLLDEAEHASDVLEHGFSHYEHAVHASYHRLKTSHNLFKWRGDVLARLEAIARDELALAAAARWVAEQSAADQESARRRVERDLALVRMQFETLPEVTDDIDRRNARFSGTALRKLMYLLRQDKRTEGQLQRLVDHLCQDGELALELDVFRCELLARDFLHVPPKRRQPVARQTLRDDAGLDKQAIRERTLSKLTSRYSRKELERRVSELLQGRERATLAELGLASDEDYVTAIYAAAFGLDELANYELTLLGGTEQRDVYGVPRGELSRRGRK